MSKEQNEIEFVKLWMEQSKLFWSRLQIAITIHSGGLAGWYYLHERNIWMGSMWLILIVFLSFCLAEVMRKDVRVKLEFGLKTQFFADYHKKLPATEKGSGTGMAFLAIYFLMFLEFMLICFGPYYSK